MVSVDQELRQQDDAAVPMCLRGFDEKGLFETPTGGGGDSDVVFDLGQVRGRFFLWDVVSCLPQQRSCECRLLMTKLGLLICFCLKSIQALLLLVAEERVCSRR